MYQARRVPFNKENYNDKRVSRAQEKAKNRRLSRQKSYASNRNIAVDLVHTVPNEAKEPEKLSRYEQLLQWKLEKERAKNEKKVKEKPPFKCGLVHHKLPPMLDAGCRRSTRLKNIKNPVKEVKIPISNSRNITGKERKYQLPSCNKMFQSFAPKSHQFKAPKNLPKIEEMGISITQSADPEEHDGAFSMSFPAQLSPWISKGRGGDGGMFSPNRKENNETLLSSKRTQSPLKVPELGQGTPDRLRKLVGKRMLQKVLKTPAALEKEEKKFLSSANTPVLSKEDGDSLQKFRSLYEGEMDRLDKLCSQWEFLQSSEDYQEIPVEVQNSICATVGQTRLLMREKLAQFNDLLHKFELKSSKSFQIITCSDLQGFWDLVSIQVNDVDAKFTSLDALKWNNWVGVKDSKDNPKKAIVRKRGLNNIILKKKNATMGTSAFKAFISEQRKKNEAKESRTILCSEEVDKNTVKEGTNDMLSPQLGMSSIWTPTTILKKRSLRKLSCSRATNGVQDDNITPKRSARKVTFAGSPAFGNKTNLSVKSSNFPAAGVDLISWDSPKIEPLTRRRSPRINKDTPNSFL